MEVTHDGGTEQQTEQAAPAAPEFDLTPIQEHIDKAVGGLSERIDGLAQPSPQEQEYARNELGQFAGQPPGQEPFAGQPYAQQPFAGQPQLPYGSVDEFGNLTPQGEAYMAEQQLQQLVAPHLQQFQSQNQALQAELATMREEFNNTQADASAERFLTAHPEYREDAAQEAFVQKALQYGRPDLVGEGWFLELVHKADRAEAAAAGETPATPGPGLEPAGGASLAGSEPSPQQQIVAAGGVRNPIFGI